MSNPLFPNSSSIINVAEAAIVAAIQSNIYPYEVEILASDEDSVKNPMPYIVIHASSAEEQIAPGSGIFKLRVDLLFRSHVKTEDINFRTAVCSGINNFLYSAPAFTLSEVNGFYCYGFVPVATGQMTVNPELKTYEYRIGMDVVCMPRNNS
jgi:hypothetical protein